MPFDEPGPASPMKGDKVTHVGSYKLMQVLGKGSFCKVRLASHIVSGQQFAVKIIKPAKSLKWSDVEREITVLRRLDHPNIIRIQQVFYADENNIIHSYVHHGPRHWPPRKMYIVMELAEGESVDSLLDIISQNFLNEEEARRLFRQILGGLEYTHAHLVVHRDLKPENIVLDSDKNIKINDFGLSCTITPGTRLKTFCGSPVYAAPEIIKKKNYDGAIADIWSLGVMLFTMVTGHLPWKPSNSSPENYFNMLQGRFTIPHRIKVSPECVDILRKMMHPEAKKRATIKELRNHPWTNEGFADRPPAFHHNYPPVPLDNTIVKQMVQMGYTSKEVQAIVRNNHTSPILTTYHAIRNLSVEMVPPFSLLNQDQTSGLPSPTLSLSSEDHSTSSPISISAGSHHVPSDFNSGRGEHGNSDTISSTPPLLRLAIDLPSGEINDNNPGDNNEDIQFNDNNNLDSPSVLTHLTPFADYRSKLGESDYYVYSSSFSPSSPSIPTSHSFPYPHHSPPSSPNISHSQNTLSYRPRGESDPPVHHQIEEEKAIEKERERISLGGSYVASVPPPSPRQFSLEGQQNASPKSKFLNFFAKLVTPSGKK